MKRSDPLPLEPSMRSALWSRTVVAAQLLLAPAAWGQTEDLPFSLGDSSVGYVESALIGTQMRVRFDSSDDARRPGRAEFLYATGAPLGPGLPLPEVRNDLQEISAYAELAVSPVLSGFVELGARLIDPAINGNSAGLGDLNAGFKLMLIRRPDIAATWQMRVYAPTGDGDRGLGTEHASIEPALLWFVPLAEHLRLEGELRDWCAIGGTDGLAGNVLRYGVGISYGAIRTDDLGLSPVAELVGWTVLDGGTTTGAPAASIAVDADGDTIVNVKLGVRASIGADWDVYAGYGRALTGDTWYDDILRLELRRHF